MLEEHRLDVELVRLELVEDQLRVVAAVVVADAGVVTPDDAVRAAVVLAADRMPDGLARAMDRVARQEADDPFPAPLGERSASLGRVAGELGKRRLRPLEDRDASRHVTRLLRVQARDAWMCFVGRAEAPLSLALLVVV